MSQLKLILVLALAGVSLLASTSVSTQADDNSPLQEYYMIHNECLNVLNEQISWELYASMIYLNMAAYFDRPAIARHGYAKFFRDQSLEEYNHAGKFIDYINSRNGTVKRISIDESPKNQWSSPKEALFDAIKLEKHVYSKIQYLHDVADQKCQDSHLTDFLESYFFIEQVDSIKELQTMLTKIDLTDPSASAVIVHMTDEKLTKSKEDL